MRKLTLALNILTATLFTAFFAYTFFAESHLRSLARNFVTEKTIQHSEPLIDAVEQALDIPFIAKLVARDDIQLAREEIDAYRDDPAAYIADLTRQKLAKPPQQPMGAIASKATAAKEGIRNFYDRTLASLIADLRIFSGTNILAASLAIALIIKSPLIVGKRLITLSFLLFVAVVYCSYLYIDDLSFFRILSSTHMGWSYPVFVAMFVYYLYKDLRAAIDAHK